MLRLLAICAVSLLLASVSVAAEGEVWTSKDGSLTYAMPEGWSTLEVPNLEQLMAVSPDLKETGLNINVKSVNSPLTIAAYADSSVAGLKEKYADFKLVSRGNFTTKAGAKAVRLVMESTPKTNKLHQVMFIIADKGGIAKYLFTGSALAGHGAASDKLFDAAAKTFAIK